MVDISQWTHSTESTGFCLEKRTLAQTRVTVDIFYLLRWYVDLIRFYRFTQFMFLILPKSGFLYVVVIALVINEHVHCFLNGK